ncbi:small nuclear ribonucleoprotein prp4, partial [Thalassiosira pseudonana CCMP1335]
ETLTLTADSLAAQNEHRSMLLDLEARKRASTMDVPTLPADVRDALRSLGEPVRMFGEDLAAIRDRLRMVLARAEVMREEEAGGMIVQGMEDQMRVMDAAEEEEVTETTYTHASVELIHARKVICDFSLERSRHRLDVERRRHSSLVKQLDDSCEKIYKTIRNLALEGSQYGDVRPLSAVYGAMRLPKLIATGGWSGGIKLWNGGGNHNNNSSGSESGGNDRSPLDLFGEKMTTMIASASIDLTAKLCKECAHLKGHAARLCSVAFHPTGRFVATTSFDHTWRLWDVETSSMEEGKELLLQDGHAREVYGVGFHPDGSLVATTDFGGVVQCWDLRTGKSACHFLGHAKRVVCSEFSPNGFQLATAGDDGTIKIWDLRRRRLSTSIPAHTNVITQLKFAHSSSSQNGEFLTSSSFDGTGKIWSTRDWKLLTTLQGHEGKVMGIDVLDGQAPGIVTCGFDKTLKLW